MWIGIVLLLYGLYGVNSDNLFMGSSRISRAVAEDACTQLANGALADAEHISKEELHIIGGEISEGESVWVGNRAKLSPFMFHVGCYPAFSVDSNGGRKITGNNIYKCSESCKSLTLKFIGLHQDICFCFEVLPDYTLLGDESDPVCNTTCSGYFGEQCGGQTGTSIYKLIPGQDIQFGGRNTAFGQCVMLYREIEVLARTYSCFGPCENCGYICKKDTADKCPLENACVMYGTRHYSWREANTKCINEDRGYLYNISESDHEALDIHILDTFKYWTGYFRTFEMLENDKYSPTDACVTLQKVGTKVIFESDWCGEEKRFLCSASPLTHSFTTMTTTTSTKKPTTSTKEPTTSTKEPTSSTKEPPTVTASSTTDHTHSTTSDPSIKTTIKNKTSEAIPSTTFSFIIIQRTTTVGTVIGQVASGGSHSSFPLWMIAVVILIAIAIVLVVIVLICWLCRRKRSAYIKNGISEAGSVASDSKHKFALNEYDMSGMSSFDSELNSTLDLSKEYEAEWGDVGKLPRVPFPPGHQGISAVVIPPGDDDDGTFYFPGYDTDFAYSKITYSNTSTMKQDKKAVDQKNDNTAAKVNAAFEEEVHPNMYATYSQKEFQQETKNDKSNKEDDTLNQPIRTFLDYMYTHLARNINENQVTTVNSKH